jgi:hypothetical protein
MFFYCYTFTAVPCYVKYIFTRIMAQHAYVTTLDIKYINITFPIISILKYKSNTTKTTTFLIVSDFTILQLEFCDFYYVRHMNYHA